jgi:hypothetical protein
MNRFQRMALAEKDLAVKDLATLLDKHASYISSVLSGKFPGEMLRGKISKILQKPETYLWPDK